MTPPAAVSANEATKSGTANMEQDATLDHLDDVSLTILHLETYGRMLQYELGYSQDSFLYGDGVTAVVASMKKHPDHEALQRAGMVALKMASCLNEDLQSAIGQAGGIQAILDAMTRFPSSEDIQCESLETLSNLTEHEPNAEILLQKTNVVAQVIKAMTAIPDSAHIVYYGWRVLINMKIDDMKAETLHDAKVIAALATSIKRHKNDARVAEVGVTLLHRLSEIESLKKPLRDANVRTVLAVVVGTNKWDMSIQAEAMEAFNNLT